MITVDEAPSHRFRRPDVVYWVSDTGGSRYYRCDRPAEALRSLGYRVEVSPLMVESWARAEVIVGHRLVTDQQRATWEKLADRRRTYARPRLLVYDLDDDVFAVEPENTAAHRVYSRTDAQDNIRACIRVADLVTVCSPALAEVVRREVPGATVQITPNTLPKLPFREPRREGPPMVGWASSPGGHAELDVVAPALRQLLSDGKIFLHLMGIPLDLAFTKGFAGHPKVRVTPWVTGVEAYLRAVDFDVWIAPYRNIPFNRSKYGAKVAEAAVLGIPLIASRIPPYAHLDASGAGLTVADAPVAGGAGNGRYRRGPGHWWYQAIRSMIPYTKRANHATAARRSAKRHYTETNARLWETMYGLEGAQCSSP